MTTTVTQEGLLRKLEENHNRYLELEERISDADQQKPFTPEGWSVKDFLAHMAHWDKAAHTLLVAYTHDQPLPPAQPSGNEANAEQQQVYKTMSLSDVREFWKETQTFLKHIIIDELNDQRLSEEVRTPWEDSNDMAIGDMLDNIIDHDAEHLGYIEQHFHIEKP